MRTALLCCTALTLIACSKSKQDVRIADSEDGNAAVLADGDVLSRRIGDAENARDAKLLIVKGVLGPNSTITFKAVRSVAADVHIDLDPEPGPEQWITTAHVEDADGNVLWTDRINSLYQLLRYLEVIVAQQGSLRLTINQMLRFVEQNYPQLLEFVVRVPTAIDGGTHYVLRIPDGDGGMVEALRVPIADVIADAVPPTVTGEVATLLDSGDPRDKVDLVILGDGYTAAEREKFELDAQAIADRFAQTEPFKSRLTDFNIHTVWTPSAESGAGYDCTGFATQDPNCKEDLRDTVFEMVFVITALADRLNLELGDARVAMPLQVARIYEAASAVPFDEILLVSNTRRSSGFAGLYVSVLTAYDDRQEFPDTAVHELGHSFGILGDEYDLAGDPCLNDEPLIPLPPNISATAARDELKWAHLVAQSTELPTPGRVNEVGAFAGAYNCNELYRPVHNCKMRSSVRHFCPVCAEQLVDRIYAYVDPVALDSEATVRRDGNTLLFTAPRRDESVAVHWFVDGEEVASGAEFQLEAGDGTHVEARFADDSGWIVKDTPKSQARVEWWIEN